MTLFFSAGSVLTKDFTLKKIAVAVKHQHPNHLDVKVIKHILKT